MAAFSPDGKYRKRHKNDIRDSPLIQGIMSDPRLDLLASYKLDPSIVKRLPHMVVPTYNETARLAEKVRQLKGMR
jgi:hypothetical protein